MTNPQEKKCCEKCFKWGKHYGEYEWPCNNPSCHCHTPPTTERTGDDYSHVSHTHCWDNKENPCGIPIDKHTQCCLCDLKPTPPPEESYEKLKEEFREQWKKTFIIGNGPYWPDQEAIANWWLDKIHSEREKAVLKGERNRIIAQLREEVTKEEREKAFIEGKKHALEAISEGQGWEESYDLYAEELGLPKKYNK